MRKLNTDYNLTELEEAVKAFEDLLNSKEELEEKKDIQPFFNTHPALIPLMIDLVGMSRMEIDQLEFEFRLWHDFICDIAFGSTKANTYCLIELEDAKKNSIFKNAPKNHPKFSDRFESGMSQIIDWFWKINGLKNISTEIKHLFYAPHPAIRAVLIIGRSHFLKSNSEIERLKWRIENTAIAQKQLNVLPMTNC